MNMKKIILASAALVLALSAGAQDMYYAKMLSQNNYYGTARSMGLGNAVTAVGGDLGMIGVNPAGSAVATYGQFVITPGVSISAVNTGYSPYGTQDGYLYNRDRTNKFSLPNLGASIVIDNDRDYGLKTTTFSFTVNSTNNFLRYSSGFGQNSRTSMLGNFAYAAYGYLDSELNNSNSVNWDLFASYGANQFGAYADGPEYAGSNQALDPTSTYPYLPGEINQNSVTSTWGAKTDMIMNIGLNFSDRVFLGFNIGIPTLRYNREDVFTESAVRPDDFEIIFENAGVKDAVNYVSSSNRYVLMTNADGIYAKVGIIALPTENLRIGAAFQTPTVLTISENWMYSADTYFSNSRYNGSARSPQGDYNYRLRTPYEFNVGAAYTIGGRALVSLDYELTDYSVMKYSDLDYDGFGVDYFSTTNSINNKFCGVSHSLRIGAEYRINELLSVRGGYGMMTDPERSWEDSYGNVITPENYLNSAGLPVSYSLGNPKYRKATLHSLSLGAGYASYGSFFADLALRLNMYPEVSFSPYYYADYEVFDAKGNVLNTASPAQSIKNNLWDAVLTFGWRF